MTMDKKSQNDSALDALFAAGRNAEPKASDDFLARLSADADAALPTPAPAAPARGRDAFLGRFGGWFAASGLSGAAVLGVWIGFVMPETISAYTALTEETVGLYTFLPGADLTAPVTSE